MERIRRVGNSMILYELAKRRMSEGRDEERVDSMNTVPDTVVGMKEEAHKESEGETAEWVYESTTSVEMNTTALNSVRVEVLDLRVWERVDCSVSEMVIPSYCCNQGGVNEVDLCRFVSLKLFEVGDECFANVNEVKMIGLKELERVVIGENSFMKNRFWFGKDSSRHFYLKNCEKLKELKMGRYSFSNYSVCEIENVPSLEVIEMGELNKESSNFYSALLGLKSDCDELK